MTWFDQVIRSAVGLGAAGLFLWGNAASVEAQVLKLNPSNLSGSNAAPTQSQGQINFACYDIATFTLIDCEVLAELNPFDPTFGGHLDHDLAGQLVGQLGDAKGCCDRSVDGHTGAGIYSVTYIAPEASGKVQLHLTWTPPPNWVCADNNEGALGTFRRPCTGIGHFDVGYPLQRLVPLDDPSYKVVRGDTVRHPDETSTSGTAKTLGALKLVADVYSVLVTPFAPGARLSINDISLSKGGLFDYRKDWVKPHQTHRKGTDVDINRAPVDANGNALAPVPCPDDYALQAAVGIVQVYLGTSLPSLDCELNGKPNPSGPQKHIRF